MAETTLFLWAVRLGQCERPREGNPLVYQAGGYKKLEK